jgi:glycoside/pentoside/hexuronide:cation symporter, GPH family
LYRCLRDFRGSRGDVAPVRQSWDAAFDPFMGVVADRTNTRWGKFRTWVLWSAIPFAVIFFLAFTTPGFEGAAKLVYAYIPTTREIQP